MTEEILSKMNIELESEAETESEHDHEGTPESEHDHEETQGETIEKPEKDSSGYEEVEYVLKNCQLPLIEYLPRFKEKKVLNASLQFLTDADISELFRNEIGLRGIFKDALDRYRGKHSSVATEMKKDVREEMQNSSGGVRLEKFLPFSRWNQKSVSKILEKYGLENIIDHYQENQCLTNELRKAQKLTPYKNIKRKQNQSNVVASTSLAIELTTTEQEDIEFLRMYVSPLESVEFKWKATSRIRTAQLKSCINLEDVTTKFPLMTNIDYNQNLLSIDYKILMGDNSDMSNIIKKFEKYQNFILNKAFLKKKDPRFDVKLLSDESTKNMRAFIALHELFPPGPISVLNDIPSDECTGLEKRAFDDAVEMVPDKKKKISPKKKVRNPTILDSLNSTLLIVNSDQNVKEKINELAEIQKSKKLKFHPLIVVVLNKKKEPEKFNVFVNHVYFDCETFKHALITYYQSFWVYDVRYPREGQRVVEFIQHFMFGIPSEDPRARNFIKDMFREVK